jgi:hypothetical protein
MSDRDELLTTIIYHPWLPDHEGLYTGLCPSCPERQIHGGHNSPSHAGHLADAILAAGYTKPRTITTADGIRELPALTIVVYDDMANGGLLQTYVVPDDGTVMFRHCEEFHLMAFGGDYIDAKDMPLPLTVVYEVGV